MITNNNDEPSSTPPNSSASQTSDIEFKNLEGRLTFKVRDPDEDLSEPKIDKVIKDDNDDGLIEVDSEVGNLLIEGSPEQDRIVVKNVVGDVVIHTGGGNDEIILESIKGNVFIIGLDGREVITLKNIDGDLLIDPSLGLASLFVDGVTGDTVVYNLQVKVFVLNDTLMELPQSMPGLITFMMDDRQPIADVEEEETELALIEVDSSGGFSAPLHTVRAPLNVSETHSSPITRSTKPDENPLTKSEFIIFEQSLEVSPDSIIIGNDSDNILNGGIGPDSIFGKGGNDILIGGPGSDFLHGGSGIDTADYSGSSAGVQVNLSTGVGTGGDAEGDWIAQSTQSAYFELYQGSGRFVGNLLDLIDNGAMPICSGDIQGIDLAYIFPEGNFTPYTPIQIPDVTEGGPTRFNENYGVVFVTMLNINAGGTYLFELNSDDESQLYIDGHLVVSDDYFISGEGIDQTPRNVSSHGSMELSSGLHTVRVLFKEGGGGDFIRIGYQGADTDGQLQLLDNQLVGNKISTIENIIGSNDDDIIIGDSGMNKLDGRAGNDHIEGGMGCDLLIGGEGIDTLLGGDGADILDGGDGADILNGDAGDDTLIGGEGPDTFDGGEGTDTVDYSSSEEAVQVSLLLARGLGGDAHGDVYVQNDASMQSDTFDALNPIYYEVFRTGGNISDLPALIAGGATSSTSGFISGFDLSYIFNDNTQPSYNASQVLERVTFTDFDENYGVRFTALLNIVNAGDYRFYLNSDNQSAIALDGETIVTDNFDTSNILERDGLYQTASEVELNLTQGEHLIEIFFVETVETEFLKAGFSGPDTNGEISLLDGSLINIGSKTTTIENIIGSNYDDVIIGGSGTNKLDGRAGNDHLEGGMGDDMLIGGEGIDTASYASSNQGVEVSLINNVAKFGHAAGDTLEGIENLEGSNFDDTLVGDNGQNQMMGQGGDDVLKGMLGSDILFGNDGDDIIYGGLDVAEQLIWQFGEDNNSTGEFEQEIGDITSYYYFENGDYTSLGGENWTNGQEPLNNGISTDDLGFERSVTSGDPIFNIFFQLDENELSSPETKFTFFIELFQPNEGSSHDIAFHLNGNTFYAEQDITISSGQSRFITVEFDAADFGAIIGSNVLTIERTGGTDFSWIQFDTLNLTSVDTNGLDIEDNDSLFGGAGQDLLNGGRGEDLLEGGSGADVLNGGSGIDTASYVSSGSGVQVSLWNNDGYQGDATGDTFENIENLAGSHFDDILMGDEQDNQIIGNEGDDIIDGRSGSDRLFGGEGNDTIYGGRHQFVDEVVWFFGEDNQSIVEFEPNSELLDNFYAENGDYSRFGGDVWEDGPEPWNNGIGTDEIGFDRAISAFDPFSHIYFQLTPNELGSRNTIFTFEVELFNAKAGSIHDLAFSINGQTFHTEQNIDVSSGGSQVITVQFEAQDVGALLGSNVLTIERTGGTPSSFVFFDYLSLSVFDDSTIYLVDDDFLDGGSGNDTLIAGVGSDVLVGGSGADLLDGGEGIDTVDYSDSSESVNVNLHLRRGLGGDAQGDIYTDSHRTIYYEVFEGAGDTVLELEAIIASGQSLVQSGFVPGVDLNYIFQGNIQPSYKASEVLDQVTTTNGHFGDNYGVKFTAMLSIVNAGDYKFYLNSDNQSSIVIDGQTILLDDYDDSNVFANNDIFQASEIDINLTQGEHTIEIFYKEGQGGDFLKVGFSGPDTNDIITLLDDSLHNSVPIESSIENIIGSAYDDILVGDLGNNKLEGGGGADQLDGGAGIDTASYVHANQGVTVDLGTNIGIGDEAQGDTFSQIENIEGSRFDDILIGNEEANELIGGLGNDTLIGGLGADILDGGEGYDTVDYTSSDESVHVNLLTGLGQGGHAEGDRYRGHHDVVYFELFTRNFSNLETLGASIHQGFSPSRTGYIQGIDLAYVFQDQMLTPYNSAQIDNINNGGELYHSDLFGASFSSKLQIHVAGLYTFVLNSDDASSLSINGEVVLVDDYYYSTNGSGNLHTAGTYMMELSEGLHDIDILFHDIGSIDIIRIGYSGPDTDHVLQLLDNGLTSLTAIEHVLGSQFDDVFIGDSRDNTFDGGAGSDTADYSNAILLSSNIIAMNANRVEPIFSIKVDEETAMANSVDIIEMTDSEYFSQAYHMTGTQQINFPSLPVLYPGVSSQDASFELWFRPEFDSDIDILFETGGNFNGTSLAWNGSNSTITMTAKNAANRLVHEIVITDYNLFNENTKIDGSEFVQVIGVYDRDFNDSLNSSLTLYVNGQDAGSISGVPNVNNWAGSDGSSLGGVNGTSPNYSQNTDPKNFEGDIALFQFYDFALSAQQISQNNNVLPSASGLGVTVDLQEHTFDPGETNVGNDYLISIENLIGTDFLDILIGNESDNILTGGGSRDVFSLKGLEDLGGVVQFGDDIITDFNQDDGDQIDLSHLNLAANDVSELDVAQVGTDTMITLDGGTLVLQEFDMADLQNSDFMF